MKILKIKWYSFCAILLLALGFQARVPVNGTIVLPTAGLQAAGNQGNIVEATAMGQVNYSWSLDNDERQAAMLMAKKSLVRNLIAQKYPNYFNNYETKEEQIISNIDDYILSIVVVDEQQDKEAKTYQVTIRAGINEPKLLATFLETSEKQGQIEESYLTFVFVARENPKHGFTDKNDGLKQDIKWRVSTTNEVDIAMGNIFVNNSFNVVSPSLVEQDTGYQFEVDKFKLDYENGDDISSVTLRNALKGLKDLEEPVHYLAIGTLDIDQSINDPVTGNIKVAVSVTGQVLDVLRRGARKAAVGPVQYFGEGPTYGVAKNNALKSAAQAAAKVLAAQLRANNIK